MARSSSRHAVLIVDDDRTFLNTFAREFARREWRVATADNSAAAAAEVRALRPTVVVLDLMLGEDNGLDLIEQLHAESPETRIVMTTGHPTLDTAVEAMRRGAHYYVEKPVTIEKLVAAVEAEPAAPPPVSARASLGQAERAHINRVIAQCHGNISEAARRLGMHRRSLQRKLRKQS